MLPPKIMVQNGLQDRTYYNPGHQHFYFIGYSKHPHVRTHDFWVQADLVLIYQVFSEKSEGKCFKVFLDLKQFNGYKLWCPPKCVPFVLFILHCPCLVIFSN